MENKSNSDIFHYLMDLVENEPEHENVEEPKVLSEDLKEELFDEENISDVGDDLDDILEENILTQKIKEMAVSDSDSHDELNEIIGLKATSKSEKVNYNEELELIRAAMHQNRRHKEVLQNLECKLLVMKRELDRRRGNIGECITASYELDQETDFYTSFLSPYFRDGLFPCPPNRDQIAKERVKPKLYEEKDFYPNWDTTEISALRDAIRDKIVDDYLKSVPEADRKKKKERNAILTKVSFIRNSSLDKVFSQFNIESLDWEAISAHMPNPHSTRDCRAIWDLFLKPSIKKEPWRKNECFTLIKTAKEFSFQNWDAIAEKLNIGRTGYQCFLKYQNLISKKEYSWTTEDFALLKRVIEATQVYDNTINWSKVMFYFESCGFDKLYCKWYKRMCPTGKEARRGKFNFTEDKYILQAVKKDGLSWHEVTKVLPGRNVSQIRERYVNTLSGSDKKFGAWTLEEDILLMKLVKEYGTGQWAEIARHIKNRSRTQVRQHYKHLKNVMDKDPNFTIETYRKRKGCLKKRNKVRELVKRIDKGTTKGPIVQVNDLSKACDKDGDNADLIKYFTYQRKLFPPRQSIGLTFVQHLYEITELCRRFNIQVHPNAGYKHIENKLWHEYVYEAIKFVRKRSSELSSGSPSESSLNLLPPYLISMYALRNWIPKMEEDGIVYKKTLEDPYNYFEGSDFNKAANTFGRRMFAIFGIPLMIKNCKLSHYKKITKKNAKVSR